MFEINCIKVVMPLHRIKAVWRTSKLKSQYTYLNKSTRAYIGTLDYWTEMTNDLQRIMTIGHTVLMNN